MLRRPLLVAAVVVAAALSGAPSALAQPSDEPTAAVAPAEQEEAPPVEQDPVTPEPEPAPVDTPARDPETAEPAPSVVEDPPAATEAPTSAVTPSEFVEPTSAAAEPTAAPTISASVAPTEPPTSSAPSSAPPTSTAAPVTNIDVDVDIDDHSDHSIHIDQSVRFIVEGDRYSSTYIYRDRDGRTYRGRNLDCSDFDTQADAQAVLDSSGSDVYWLDADRDGVACEALDGEFTRDTFKRTGVRRGGQVHLYPAGSIDTGLAA